MLGPMLRPSMVAVATTSKRFESLLTRLENHARIPTQEREKEMKSRIYWNVTNTCKDRYSVWMNGKEIAKYLTFDDCYALVMKMVKENNHVA
jgi:hypothetical protein